MKTYKGVEYPDLGEAIAFYQVPGQVGGFNKDERLCPNLLIKLPKSGVLLSMDGISKDEIFGDISRYGHVSTELAQKAEAKIDEVCRNYIDAIVSGDLAI